MANAGSGCGLPKLKTVANTLKANIIRLNKAAWEVTIPAIAKTVPRPSAPGPTDSLLPPRNKVQTLLLLLLVFIFNHFCRRSHPDEFLFNFRKDHLCSSNTYTKRHLTKSRRNKTSSSLF